MTEIFEIPVNEIAQRTLNKINVGENAFDDTNASAIPVPNIKGKELVPWGDGNTRPTDIINLMRNDEVLSSNMRFNIFSNYGTGLKVTKQDGTNVDDSVKDFFKFNRPTRYLIEQITDIEHFQWSVCVLILNRDGDKIVQIRHKEVTYTRLAKNNKDGKIEYIYYKDWESSEGTPEEIPLLDINDPLGDLMVRMGKKPNADGVTVSSEKGRKFAMINSIPVPGNKYYPFPYWWAIFNSGWYDNKQMIPGAKKAKFKNGLAVSYQVSINKEYWGYLFQIENISDPVKQQERITKEKNNIREFLTGMHQSGKVWFTGFYIDPTGKEQNMVKIDTVEKGKEGGDWIDDTEEASNMECYAQGIHPSLIGATPGKSKGSFSGSDKRELFTIHQILNIPIREILLEPYFVIANFNNWDMKVEIPIVLLTTLDKKTDAQTINT